MSDKGSRKADLWQRKYYDSLDELEQKEKQWQELESLLRLLASRLTLLSNASDEQLEKKLDKLRSNLRYEDNAFKFRPLINEINSIIASSDSEIKSGKSEHEFLSAKTLNNLLDEINIPEVFKRQEKHVRKRIGRAKSEKDIPDLIKDMAELLGLTMEHLAEQKIDTPVSDKSESTTQKETAQIQPEPIKEKTGLLKNIFSRNRATSKEDPQPDNKEENLELKTNSTSEAITDDSDRDINIAATENSADESEETGRELSADDISYAANILIELLEQLELPHDLCVEARLIRQRLEPCHEQEKLAQGLEATAALVAEAHTRVFDEKKELEAFLKQLTQRLHEIDSDLQETARLQQLSLTGSKEVNAAVEEEVRGIEQSVENASDLSMLQTDIQSRVIIIRDHMDRFLQAEMLRDKQSGALAENLKKELSEAEEEIEALRKQLERAREESMKDALTGLLNRKAYDQYINDELARFKRYHSAFVLAVWDIDLFKSINDNYGHIAGDKVLKIIASVISENTRETDIVARYGGEEFVVIMPETTLKAAHSSLDKLRVMIENCAFHFRGKRVVITASCGLTESQATDTADTIFKRADSGLYRAKENGRNRCEIVA